MRRSAVLIALIAVAAVPNAVQVQGGWKVRIDGSHSASAPDAEGEKTHGIAGIRIDGTVDLQVDGFEVQQPFTPPVRGQ